MTDGCAHVRFHMDRSACRLPNSIAIPVRGIVPDGNPSSLLTGVAASLCFWLLVVGLGCAVPAETSAAEPTGFAWTNDEAAQTADLSWSGQPVVQYRFAYDVSTPERTAETYKPYLHVYGPRTGTLLTKGPGGLYTHHRGLYLGWNKTLYDGTQCDFWHCTQGAHQRHVTTRVQTVSEQQANLTVEIHWNDAAGKPVIVEQRAVVIRRMPIGGTNSFGWQLDWESQLENRRGPLTLTGDRQHSGLQFRAAQQVAETNGATYTRPTGFPTGATAVEVSDATMPDAHINLPWLAMHYTLTQADQEPQHYTVQYLPDPALPQPQRYSERPYGRFGAFFITQLESSEVLKLRYRILVTEEQAPGREELQRRYDRFLLDLKSPVPQ